MTGKQNHTAPEQQHEQEPEDEQQAEYVGPSLLDRYLWYFALVAFSLLACAITWVLYSQFIDIDVPPQLTLFTTAFLTGSILYVLPSVLICSWLWNPRPYFVVDLDAESTYFAIYRLSEKSFKELEFTEGQPFTLGPKVISVRNYDMETNTAEGTWRGSMDDLELARKLENVEDLKTDFENMAKQGLSYRSKYTRIIYDAVTRIHTAFLLDFETEVFKSGEAVQESISESIDAHVPDLEPREPVDRQVNLDGLDLDRRVDLDGLDEDPFGVPTSNGTDDELNPRSTRWSRDD